jgi:SAM-dependent methyltransferase
MGMAQKVGNVDLVLDHHDDKVTYSDGDVEEDIMKYVSQGADLNDVIKQDLRWPVLYHLSKKRENLLDWYDFDPDASLLEIGAGCGALTGLFCRKVARVTAVEISERRARIVATRNQSANGLTVHAGRIEDLPMNRKFDYATLIGVLEYAGRYHGSENPYVDFLRSVRERLAEGGTLILAIENKLGLKYWAGAPEDHTGVMFENIEGYVGRNDVRTFGRQELIELLKTAGFTDFDFYYPMPDYKMPDLLFSDEYTPHLGDMSQRAPNFDQPRSVLFREGRAMDNVIKNGGFGLMANSFLVFCRG